MKEEDGTAVTETAPRQNAAPRLDTALPAALPAAILALSSVFFCFWNRVYFSDQYIPGCDLPGQVAIIELMMAQLPHLHFSFYDPGWFCGWGVDLFYAPLSHILTAMVAYPLSLISKEPARLACHLGLVIGSAALPFSIWYFLLPLTRAISQKEKLTISESCLLALSICFMSFWFLNHDNQAFGIGFASVMGFGLYTQLWGWHLLMLHAGALTRLLATGERKFELLTMILFALLFCTHSLTAIFAGGIVLMISLWYSQSAIKLWRIHIMAVALTAFWSLPAFALSRTYAVVSPIKNFGDIFELLFRYPLSLLLRHLESCLAGHFVPLDIGTLLVPALFFLFIPLKPIQRSQAAVAFFIVDLIAVVFTNSPFIARSLYASIHYYRFLGDELLYLAALLALVPSGIVQSFANKRFGPAPIICVALVLCAGIFSTMQFPMLDRQKIAERAGQLPPYQTQVLEYFSKSPLKGRVFFEFFEDESKYGYFAGHYLESRLFKETGFESVNGLFIESVNSYRLPATAAGNLGAHSWATSLFLNTEKSNADEQALRQLKEFGITHIVCGADSELLQRLKNKCLSAPVILGPYAICQISPLPGWKIETAGTSKSLIGYIDKAGNLPFEDLQTYAFAHDEISSNWEIIDLTGSELISNIPVIIVNTGDDSSALSFSNSNSLDSSLLAKIRPIRLNFSRHDTIDHYHVWYQDNPEFDSYRAIAGYFEKIDFIGKLRALRPFACEQSKSEKTSKPSGAPGSQKPELQWSSDYQSMNLRNLQPGVLTKIDYSFLPFWHSNSARVLKGTNEQIFVLPENTEVKLSYDPSVSPYFWLGLLISAASLTSLLLPTLRSAKPKSWLKTQ